MNKPNFFIVGAPKCGTTALHSYLQDRPEVFMCAPKEPGFFTTDFPSHRYVTEQSDYLDLFRRATSDQTILGESSAWYMYSEEAIPNIFRYNPDAKIIVMVRNPLRMLPSLHGMLRLNFAEHEDNLELAWELQESRRRGENYAANRNQRFDKKVNLYSDVCKLGAQLKRVLTVFPEDQVHVIVFDDFVKDTKTEYENVLSFLKLKSDGRDVFNAVNVRRSFKSQKLAKLSWRFREIGSKYKRALGIKKTFNVLEFLNKLNESEEARPKLNADFQRIIANEFRSDINLLGQLIDRDLSDWYSSD